MSLRFRMITGRRVRHFARLEAPWRTDVHLNAIHGQRQTAPHIIDDGYKHITPTKPQPYLSWIQCYQPNSQR